MSEAKQLAALSKVNGELLVKIVAMDREVPAPVTSS